MQFEIRDYRAEDFPSLEKLWQLTGIGGPERGDNADTIFRCNTNGGKLLVMTDKKQNLIIGSSWITCDGRRMYLHHFCILPEYQNRGLGKKLLHSSLRYIRQTGLQVKLEVHQDNAIAKKLYSDAGFFSFVNYDIMMIRDVKNIALPGE